METNEFEDKILQLQICIDEGHNFEMDKDTFDADSVILTCSRCEYSKKIKLTANQAKKFDKLFDDEISLENEIIKNEEAG